MDLDFILPSFPPLPDSIWIAASAMLDQIIPKCWLLLAGFVTIKIIVEALQNYERVSLATHVSTVFKAIMVVIFLHYYKQILMCFDYFVDSLCIHTEGSAIIQQKLTSMGQPLPRVNPQKLPSFWQTIKALVASLAHIASLFTFNGAVKFMHYMRAVALLLLMQIGPLSMLFSWLPGPFQRSFHQWIKSYVHISCWAITLQILWVLSEAFRLSSFHQGVVAGLSSLLLTAVLLIVTFMAPSWTAKFIGSASLGNFVASAGGLASKAGKSGGQVAMRTAKKFLGRNS